MGNETKEMLEAILNKLDTMDEKIDSLVKKMYEYRKESNDRFDQIDRQLRNFDSDIGFLSGEIAGTRRGIRHIKSLI